MRGNRLLLTLAVTGLAVAAAVVPFAAADDRTCNSSLGAITVDNLRVPQNSTCVLNRTRVNGTVTVGRNGRLIASYLHAAGDLEATNSAKVTLFASRVAGTVRTNGVKIVTVSSSRILGDLRFQGNKGRSRAIRVKVGGDVDVQSNVGRVLFLGNVIAGNLTCAQNSPRPRGAANVVGGLSSGQCASLSMKNKDSG